MDEYTPEGIEPVGDAQPEKLDTEWQWAHQDGTVLRVTTSRTLSDFRHTVVFLWLTVPEERLAELPIPERRWFETTSEATCAAFIAGVGTALSTIGFRQVA